MQPTQHDRILELVNQIQTQGKSVPATWFVGADGLPIWAEQAKPSCLIEGFMTLQPRMGGPEFRVVDFEEFPNSDITIVRVLELGTDADRDYLAQRASCNDESEYDISSEFQKRFPIPTDPNAQIINPKKGMACGVRVFKTTLKAATITFRNWLTRWL